MMAWRRPGDKPLSETMMVSLLTHICVTRHQWVKRTVARIATRKEALLLNGCLFCKNFWWLNAKFQLTVIWNIPFLSRISNWINRERDSIILPVKVELVKIRTILEFSGYSQSIFPCSAHPTTSSTSNEVSCSYSSFFGIFSSLRHFGLSNTSSGEASPFFSPSLAAFFLDLSPFSPEGFLVPFGGMTLFFVQFSLNREREI